MKKHLRSSNGFTLVEMTLGLVIIGVVLLAFAGVMNVMQRGSATTSQYGDAQQNVRTAIEFITDNLRAAGSDIAAYDGQVTIAAAEPYQVVFNGDFDRGEVWSGEQPLGAIDAAQSPSSYPPTGATLYSPTQSYGSGAETIVFTLDSDQDGVVTTADRGDDAEEDIENDHLYVLKRYVQGYETGSTNAFRESNVSLVRGPVAYADGTTPPPLFQYFLNDDNDKTTPDVLWGDSDANGELDGVEISALTSVPDSLLHSVRRVKVTVVGEALTRNPRFEDNDGFVSVQMTSNVFIRNVDIREACLIIGTVYYDANQNGTRDQNESGIPNVKITLGGYGRKTVTDAFGNYTMPSSPGSFSVVETDPTGYTSSTPNDVAVTLEAGEKKIVDFGDTSNQQFGYISGTVYNDINEDGVKEWDEEGIAGVVVMLSNDMSIKTKDSGYYRFTVPLGTYTVTEIDLPGYASITPNEVNANLAAQGDSVVVNYGDIEGEALGTLRGWVYVDDDRDGEHDFGEDGLADVEITLSDGTQGYTDQSGYYEFQLEPAKYDIYELDPDDYTSTTPNIVEGVWVVVDSTSTVNFGDMLIEDLDFIEVFVGDTERPLSVSASDIREDLNRDVDIVLGTPTSVGPGNVFIFENQWTSSLTPVSELFDPNPTGVRSAGNDVNALETFDFTGDLRPDILTGLESTAGSNMQLWINQLKGGFGNSADVVWTSGYSSAVSTTKLTDINRDGFVDVIVGHRSGNGTYQGGFEVVMSYGYGSLYPVQTVTTFADGQPIGEVVDLDVADLDGDGDRDIVLAANNGPGWGYTHVFLNDGSGYNFTWHSRYVMKAQVNQVDAVELWDKGTRGVDLLVGITEVPGDGGVQVWVNRGTFFGQADTTGFQFYPHTTHTMPDEYIDPDGEALVVESTRLDGDLFDEILIGTRSSLFFTGDLILIHPTGTGEPVVQNVKVNVAGEVVAVDFADFNGDGFKDIVATTRTSETSGKLAVYFLDTGLIAQ